MLIEIDFPSYGLVLNNRIKNNIYFRQSLMLICFLSCS